MVPSESRVVLEVDLSAIRKNFLTIRRKVAPADVMVVLKANAYGLGLVPVARTLEDAGASRIGVAEIKEASALFGKVKIPVQILGGLLNGEIAPAVRMNLVCPVGDLETANALSREALRQKKNIRVHFKIDTGMGRLGMQPAEAPALIRRTLALPRLVAEGIYTHFPSANFPERPITQNQIARFKKLLSELGDLHFPLVHLANSDAINNFSTAWKGFRSHTLVRTGINLYGVFDLEGRHILALKPTLKLKTRLIARRLLPAGHTVGYGQTHRLKKSTLVGTIPAGYADGVPLAASNQGQVLLNGKRCPIIGRVSMDYVTVDLGNAKSSHVGDEVILIGKSGSQEITVEDWARIKNTHPYEIICSLGGRVERRYSGK